MWMVIAAMAMQANAQPALPGWMAGCWEQKSEARWTEECWTSARGGMMLGSNRTGAGEAVDQWEAMQIALQDSDDPAVPKMAFWASPSGVNRTMFIWVPSAEAGVTFVNPANDYPQRIRYWRDGEELHAEISLSDGSKPMRWRFSRPATR